MNTEKIGIVYCGLMVAKRDYYQASEGALVQRARLESARLKALADGTIQGKNETEREARARELFADAYGIQAELDAGERYARLALDLAQIEVEMVRAQMRAEELTTRIYLVNDAVSIETQPATQEQVAQIEPDLRF
jgi:hypothetical protein